MSLLTEASLVILPNAVKEGELLSIIPADGSGDMTAVRATTATLVNSEGVIEDCPYNLVSYSEEFDNSYWNKLASSITANSITSPDGNTTADKLIEDTSGSAHRFISTSFLMSSGTSYSASIFLKRGEREYAYIRLNNSGGDIIAANINLLNGTVSQLIFGNITIIPYNNDWYRVIATGTPISTSNGSFEVRVSNSPTYANYTGDGTSGIYIWGAQLVTGTEPKEYFPTTDRLNVPRLDYTNGSCPSILVEPQRTNLVLRSEEFDNSYWAKNNVTITQNTTIAPDGNLTSDKIVENTTVGLHRIFATPSCSGSTTYTASIFVKKSERTRFEFLETILGGCVFDLTNGTIISGTDGFIESYNNDWYRCGIKRTTNVSQSLFVIQVRLIISGTNNTYLGDGTSGIYIWGAQLEAGANATSYIPTVASAVTRNADVISKTGISDLIGQTEGTIYFETNKLFVDSLCGYVNISESSQNRILIYGSTLNNQLSVQVRVNNVTTVYANFFTGMSSNAKVAFGYKNGDSALYINGVKYSTTLDTINYNFPVTLSKLDVMNYDGSNFSNGTTKVCSLFKTRLTNTQLQQLTTL